jgi:hypothetical protein
VYIMPWYTHGVLPEKLHVGVGEGAVRPLGGLALLTEAIRRGYQW